MANEGIPPRFRELGLPAVHTGDGFWMSRKSIADILLEKDIRTFPNERGEMRECGLFFDDWHLYAIEAGGWIYSLVKLREQEHDKAEGRIGDGDTPGVTVSFIALRPEALTACLAEPTMENRRAMNREINRVVAARGQSHHPALKAYFEKTESMGAYLIAEEYVRKIASLAKNGRIPTPDAYKKAKRSSRLPAFIEKNNAAAGYTVCDHESIFIRDAEHPNPFEKLAILAAYTADVSFPGFAAEVQFHACFLTAPARIPIWGHSLYDSAIRADMTIDIHALEDSAPFYNPDSRWVRRQAQCHPEYAKLC